MADFQDISIFVTLRHEIEAGEYRMMLQKRIRSAALVEEEAEWKRQKQQQEQEAKQAESEMVIIEDTQNSAQETAGERATLAQGFIDVKEILYESLVFEEVRYRNNNGKRRRSQTRTLNTIVI